MNLYLVYIHELLLAIADITHCAVSPTLATQICSAFWFGMTGTTEYILLLQSEFPQVDVAGTGVFVGVGTVLLLQWWSRCYWWFVLSRLEFVLPLQLVL
jgi:hypothetical protein